MNQQVPLFFYLQLVDTFSRLLMAKHIHTGKVGEQLAEHFFVKQGYAILEKNWRFSRWEVDIIASQNDVLHFVEIKTRRSKNYGLPEEKVGTKKIRHLISAAEQYLYLYPQWKRIQFDVLSITMMPGKPVEYFLIEDVYL